MGAPNSSQLTQSSVARTEKEKEGAAQLENGQAKREQSSKSNEQLSLFQTETPLPTHHLSF